MSRPVKRAARSKGKSKNVARRKSVTAKPVAKVRAKAAPQATAAPQEPAAAPAVAVAAAPTTDTFYLKLDASCTLRETADLQFSLVVATGDPVVVDGSAVERIDTAGLQLLVALARRQQHRGGRLEWKAVSPELVKCGARLGLIEALGLPAAAGDTP